MENQTFNGIAPIPNTHHATPLLNVPCRSSWRKYLQNRINRRHFNRCSGFVHVSSHQISVSNRRVWKTTHLHWHSLSEAEPEVDVQRWAHACRRVCPFPVFLWGWNDLEALQIRLYPLIVGLSAVLFARSAVSYNIPSYYEMASMI